MTEVTEARSARAFPNRPHSRHCVRGPERYRVTETQSRFSLASHVSESSGRGRPVIKYFPEQRALAGAPGSLKLAPKSVQEDFGAE